MPNSTSKGDRALELYEKGIPSIVIAERLGVRMSNINDLINNAKARREKRNDRARNLDVGNAEGCGNGGR